MYRPVGRWDGQVDNSSLSNALVVQNEASADDHVAPVKSERMKSLDAFRGSISFSKLHRTHFKCLHSMIKSILCFLRIGDHRHDLC
jgi:hypothetical protein